MAEDNMAPSASLAALTDEQIVILRRETYKGPHAPRASDLAFARALLAAPPAAPQPSATALTDEHSQLLTRLMVAGCTCDTKTPELRHHDANCQYRCASEIYDLLAAEQPSEDRRDAERYRWLRERNWNESALFVVSGHHSLVRLGTDCPSGERLDAAIDAAIAKGEE